MQNYFTGDFSNQTNHKQTDTQIQQSTQVNTQNNQTINEDNVSLNLENLHIQQKNKQNFVNVQEVIVDDQEQQKLIQNNPTEALQQKKLGNQKYTQKIYSQALSFYIKSLQYTDTHTQQNLNFRSVIYSNIGLTHMKMNQDQKAIEYLQKSLKLNQNYIKARTNLAQCYQNTDKIQQALQQYKKVLETTPNDNYVKQKLIPLEIKVKQLQQKRKEQVIGGLKNIGNSILGYFGMSLDNFKLQQGPGGGYNVQFKQ